MKIRIFSIIIVLIIAIGVATMMISNQQKIRILPIINPTDVNPHLVDSSLHRKGIGHIISDFSLTNQYGKIITRKDVKNKIIVADFFFTSCGGVCPKMTRNLQKIQAEFMENSQLLLLSHTVWPEVDSVEVLKKYAKKYIAKEGKWHFLTGNKNQLYKLARKSYLVAPDKRDTTFEHGNETDFIHTENFVLIDQKLRIRGIYNGTSQKEIHLLISDINLLLKASH